MPLEGIFWHPNLDRKIFFIFQLTFSDNRHIILEKNKNQTDDVEIKMKHALTESGGMLRTRRNAVH